MKKVLSAVLAIVMIFNIGVCATYALDFDATTSIASVNASPGDKIEVFISVDGKVGIKTLSFYDFVYDEEVLTVVEDECAWLIYGKLKDVDIKNNASIITFDDNTAYSGNVLKLVFVVSEDVEIGNYPISCKAKATRIVNQVETEINITNANSIIRIVAPQTEKKVSGTVTSFLSEIDEITLTLTDVNNAGVSYSTSVVGNTAEYSFENVKEGNYILIVSKNNHVARTYDVEVSDGNVSQDVKIHLVGDINGDGRVMITDYSLVLRYVKKTTTLEGYEFDCADVDENGRVMITDYSRILRHVKKTEMLW